MPSRSLVRFALIAVLASCALPGSAAAQSDSLFERASRSRMKGPPAAAVLVY